MNIGFSWNFLSSYPLLNHLHLRLLKGIGKTTTDLIADLASPDVREYAIQILVSFGDEVVPHLVQSLANDNPDVRLAVAQILGQIGPASKIAIPDLVQRLVDTDCSMRDTAAQALDKIDTQWHKTSQVQTAIPYLVQRLTDGINVRRAAVQALDKINKQWHKIAIPYLVQQLKDSKANTRMAAINALKEIGPTAQAAIPNLLQRLADDIRYVREAATESLDKIDPQWRKIPQAQTAILAQQQANNIQNARETEAVIQQLKDSDPDILKVAARKLGEIGPAAQVAIPDLAQLLTNKNPDVRWAVTYALEEIGPAAQVAIPDLILAITNDAFIGKDFNCSCEDVNDRNIWWYVILFHDTSPNGGSREARLLETLLRINPEWHKTQEAKSTIPTLMERVKSSDLAMRSAAAMLLGLIGPAAQVAIPALAEILDLKQTRDDYRSVFYALHESAATALAQIGGPAAISELMKRSVHDSQDNWELVARSFGQMGTVAIPELVKNLPYLSWNERDAVKETLKQIDPQWHRTAEAKSAIPDLIKTLEDKKQPYYVREAAAYVLGQMGSAAISAIPALITALADKNSEVRKTTAIEALDKIDPQWRSKYKTDAWD